ncbi:uridine kinase [Actinocrinis puniceicyclus]|uniref:Uridine kinase n=1 Tax=Actinocrinis puniceicyclus TaxID=977794 RepID=A0A8J7WNM7_9ACTN|nr:uridine kinase [Actinocrinis puniceicyclus]MBS2964070.1 uridine kinase [Actinocrinis puniceicyclus]
MDVRAISPALLVERLADQVAALAPGTWVRVALDGAPAARPGDLARDLVDPLRVRGRAALRVSAEDFLRPASLRLEYGRTDPDVYYDGWLDTKALVREVLGPLEPGGSGRVLPALWDAERDRASRHEYTRLTPGGVLLLDGALLLGRGLPFEFTVHLWLSAAALARRTGPDTAWTLPAFARYEREAQPLIRADVVVRVDDPRHPALVQQL